MKKLLQTLYLTAALIGVTPAHAKEHYALMGEGTRTCAQFAQDYRRNPQNAETLYFIWAQGYMSAANTALQYADAPRKDLNSLPIGYQQQQIREFCNTHPLALYDQALPDLFDQFTDMPAEKTDQH